MQTKSKLAVKLTRLCHVWARLGIVARLMTAVGLAIAFGGGLQTYLTLVGSAAGISERHRGELAETLELLAPLVADQALTGSYDTVQQLLQAQVKKKKDLALLSWTDERGGKMSAQDAPLPAEAPAWFSSIAPIDAVEATEKVVVGGVSYGVVYGRMTRSRASNMLWADFIKHLQVLSVTLLLMLQLIWLIFRGNLGTLRMLAVSANRFSHGDHAIRIEPGGAPEVVAAAVAFNDMANNIENLIGSLGESERNNRRLAAIVQQSSEAIWTADLSGRITTWNPGAAALFGYSAAEAIGNDLKLDSGSSPAEEQGRVARIEAGERFSFETRVITKGGTQIDVEVAVAPLYDEDNLAIGKIGIAHDVSERKRAEQELDAARQAAEAASKAKGSFLARMSHEIRTPMNGVLGMTELLLETALTPPQRKFAETAQRSGKTLLGILNDILDFSKIEAGKLDLENIDFDVRQTVEDTLELLAERAQSKNLELTCTLPAGLVTRVKGDPLRLGQVLLNLVGNAIKFTENGEVTVCVRCEEDTPGSALLRFDVADTGPGISEEAQSRIFENFSQADGSTTRKHGGTGLGLAISRQLVEMMGGTMKLDSTPGVGSTFWFVARFDKQQTPARADSAYGNVLRGTRVLIVAFRETTRTALGAQIGTWGMHENSVPTAEQALDSMREAAARGAPYDVVIIDSMLSGMGTTGLTKTIKADSQLADARLIVLIPVGREGAALEAQHAGRATCVSKPVRQSALYDSLVSATARTAAVSITPLERTSAAPRPPGGRLLLAEDNPVNQQVALGMLNIEGYDVTVASNGAEALDIYFKSAFDLVLMDCHMPHMDGFEATRAIRELQARQNLKRVPIIALTANAMQQDRDDCLNAGMDDHLTKPYSRVQMRAMLERWLPPASVNMPSAIHHPGSDRNAPVNETAA